MSNIKALFDGKRITVMGLGLLGRGLGDTLFLIRSGARVTVTDLKTEQELAESVKKLQGLPCTLKFGGHDPADFTDADMVLRNADVPRSSEFLRIAAANGVPVEMDESLFCKNFRGTVVGITGTRGKTTTTVLVHRILQAAGHRAFLSGNLLGCATLPLLEQAGPQDIVVLELSSWQLQGFHDARISPHASIFTNVYPDHLNRYSSMDEYIADKKAVYLYQRDGDFCLFNREQPECAAMADEAPAGRRFFSVSDVPSQWNIRLPGRHNLENIAAAIGLARLMGVPDEVIRPAVESFNGVEHRLQWLGKKEGIVFVNDSTSTTPAAGLAALEALSGRSILLIAGGSHKNLDLVPFAKAAAERCKRIALLEGTATDALHEGLAASGAADKIVGRFDAMAPAVDALLSHARPGDVMLLSPACASFGMFRNEYHRGETFMALVRDILGSP
ncbi:MAG: UDP-N-acetylmuramoyl-L-alanine--D-glutamate ligase [Desulfomonile sp.]|nr:UDP-N-acetylmuramoyl-L-alanine--D-glutamate ligase [Desulfomonile sp.]